MARPRKPVPSYRLHRQSGQARVTLTDSSGRSRDVLLGTYNSPESIAKYHRVLAEWSASGKVHPITKSRPLTVNDLLLRFFTHAEAYYRHPDGRPTSELGIYKYAVGELVYLYGNTPADQFGPLALKAVRQRMISPPAERKRRLSRGVINQYISKIKSIFQWAVGVQIVPETVHRALCTVTGLQYGRTDARETADVEPVSDDVVNATLPFVSDTVRGMIELQRLTGMRPGEICELRTKDIDRDGDVWIYKPARHKTSWRGRKREIAIGPRGQAILRSFLTDNVAAPVFNPTRSYHENRARRTRQLADQSSVALNQVPAKRLRQVFSASSYSQAVARAIKAANKAAVAKAREEGRPLEPHEIIPHWNPQRLRHSAATRVRKAEGIEAAQVVLGHADIETTEIYAKADREIAVHIARAHG